MGEHDLVEQARAALLNSPHLPLRRLQPKAERGKLVLRGVVRSYFHKQMAQETLRHLPEGWRIDNQVLVEWEPLAQPESQSEAGLSPVPTG
ncbi:MAG: BON domain-containing protein [Pirellulales bacterium]|jgi:hypothetical protein|nr:BON domain-containing protein [Pirellulales bacterium]